MTDSYPPEICAVSTLMNELALSLVGRGHKVFVLTSKPQNRVKKNAEKNHSLVSEEKKVTIIRVSIPQIHTKSFIKRGFNTILLPNILYTRTPKKIRKNNYDAIIAYAPPISLGLAAKKIASLNKAPFILVLRDIFPQNAIDLGILKNKLAIKHFEHIERKVYRSSDFILAQSFENRDFLTKRKQIEESRVGVLYNWIDISKYSDETAIDFRSKFHLDSRKVCLFAGTMGPSQDLEKLLSVADMMRDDDVLFLFVGNGREKKSLEQLANRMRLTNVKFEDYVEQEFYPSLLNAVQIGLVSLSENNHTPIVPGKLLGYMAGRIPIMAFLNKESTDTMKILDESGCGKYITDGDIKAFSKILREMIQDASLRKRMGKSGREYVDNNFSVINAVKEIERVIMEKKKP